MFNIWFILGLSNPTIGRLFIKITGTPVCPVFLCKSLAAEISRLTSISVNLMFFSRKYLFAELQKLHVGVVNITTFGCESIVLPNKFLLSACLMSEDNFGFRISFIINESLLISGNIIQQLNTYFMQGE